MQQQPQQQQPQQEQPIPFLGLTQRQLSRVIEIAEALDVDKRGGLLERLGAQFRIGGRRGQVSDADLEAALTSALVGLQQGDRRRSA